MSDFNFGFTGTRQGMTGPQKGALRIFLCGGAGQFHHGDCIGADSEAHDIADDCGYAIVLHPPTDYSKRAWRDVPRHMMRPEQPYMVRNRQIVNSVVALIAAPAAKTVTTACECLKLRGRNSAATRRDSLSSWK